MRKVLCLLLSLMLTAAAAGCGSGTPDKENTSSAVKTEEAGTQQTVPEGTQLPAPEKLAEIVNREGKKLGAIDANAACSAADGGIFYRIIDQQEYAFTGTAWYRFFRAEDGKDILLGTLEDQGYETFYARTELDGVIYTLAVSGNPFDSDPDPLLLLAFDPAAETMKTCEVSKFGFPYAAMTAAGGKLLIMNHEMSSPKCDKVYEFDPASGAVRELLSFADDGKASLRSITAAEDGFYLLWLGLDGGSPAEVFLNRYDRDGKILAEPLSLNGLIIPAVKDLPGFEGETDVLNECGLNVSGFAVQDGRYLFYENFGRIRVIIDLQTGEALFADEDLWSMAHGGGEPAFFEIAFEPYANGEGPKIVYLQDGKLQTLPFRQDDSRFFLQSASRSADGTWLFSMASDRDENRISLWQEN